MGRRNDRRTSLGLMAMATGAGFAAAGEPEPWARLAGETQVVFAGSGTTAAGPDVPAHTYRIPAIAVTGAGSIRGFAEARRQGAGDSGDIDIVVRRSTDRGRTWSAETIVADDDGATWRIALALRGSRDDGRTWPLSLAVHPGGAAYSDLAVLADGTVLVLFERDCYRTIGLQTIALAAKRDDAP